MLNVGQSSRIPDGDPSQKKSSLLTRPVESLMDQSDSS